MAIAGLVQNGNRVYELSVTGGRQGDIKVQKSLCSAGERKTGGHTQPPQRETNKTERYNRKGENTGN